MTYLKIIQYIYLFFGLFFLYDAYAKYASDENPFLSIAIAVVAIGMFFFRKHMYNKQNRDK